MFPTQKLKHLNNHQEKAGKVIYYMNRDIRAIDNWALSFAQMKALEYKSNAEVIFCLVPNFLEATRRQYHFLLESLKEVEMELHKKNIPFTLLLGDPIEEIPKYVKKTDTSLLVTDFFPLKIAEKWKKEIARSIEIPMIQVDTHNIVPCWFASDKQEFAARTFRPKVNKSLPKFLKLPPKIKKQDFNIKNKTNWKKAEKSLQIDENVLPVKSFPPGRKAALQVLKTFINKKLTGYAENRNDPNAEAISNLSPYMHFGVISPEEIALAAKNAKAPLADREAFLEEFIVRRELSDNFCYYNKNYDSIKGIANWAKLTLEAHKEDLREYIYSKKQFEKAKTHDSLWNAAQNELLQTGKIHGYMRMYWAKKILEWTKSPEVAVKIAIYLNDKYALDGRDPNGYVGILWSIGGVHDRAWFERPIFGKIRYMNDNGAKRKFDVQQYIESYNTDE
ncbi:deoxyribodipyrimidine photo-lyase [Patescibacteria group bacterium]|nr:deoxyribodipyrimidine photo-lyase [Patescibacteria group bacterium]MBU1721440.1 deoxyribodipyrimidine photo-lyase [Patescibacteria group bacterium]MBU1901308.1 deoxyribodipyrimidine photo-lyase [Patescibacteria group bacterium]